MLPKSVKPLLPKPAAALCLHYLLPSWGPVLEHADSGLSAVRASSSVTRTLPITAKEWNCWSLEATLKGVWKCLGISQVGKLLAWLLGGPSA